MATEAISEVRLPIETTVRARDAALAWLNAFLATSQDEDRPALCRTLSLEWFDAGLHIIGCDGTALFRTWVPASVSDSLDWPDIAEVPNRSVVVMDPDGFGVAFMRTLLSVTNDETHQFGELHVGTSASDDAANLALGAEFMSERITLRAFGQRLDLRLMDGPFPDWRNARLGMDAAERMEGLTIGTRMFALVGKLKGVTAIDMEFYGTAKNIAFTGRGDAQQKVRGLLMPMRRVDVEA